MSQTSADDVRDGAVYNGFDYKLQVWVMDGIVQNCGHKDKCYDSCMQRQLHGQQIVNIDGREQF